PLRGGGDAQPDRVRAGRRGARARASPRAAGPRPARRPGARRRRRRAPARAARGLRTPGRGPPQRPLRARGGDGSRRLPSSARGLPRALAGRSVTWDVPERFNFTRDVVERLRGPALTFLAAQGARRELGFEEVSARTARWAAVVRRAGVQKGDRVLVLVGKTP